MFGQIPGGAMGERTDYRTEIKEKFKKINLSDGVSKEEAIIIAQNYMLENNGEEDYIIPSAEIFAENDPYWSKESWHISFKTKLKFRLRTSLEWMVVNVDKKTGKVTSGGGGPS
jgi:hypothetical protein